MSDISKGMIYNIQQTLLKEWGPDSLGVLPEDTMQELLTGVSWVFWFFSLLLVPTYPTTLFILKLFPFLYLQGLNLLELAGHLEEKATQLRCEGLGRIKIALAGTDTSSLLEILEGHFGHMDMDISESTISTEKSEKKAITEEETSDIPEKILATPSNVGSLATAELVFPLKSIPTVIAGLPEPFLPLHGPETLSRYHCQVPSCSLEFSQKAVACNHVCCDHLNIALACLYCSFENNPKMWWYSASAWEHHTLKHVKENLPIHPDDPEFSQQFAHVPGDEATPSTSKPNLTSPMQK